MPDTSPRFAILQRSLEIPDVERLKRAFRSVKCLTDSDAHTLARDAFGILVKNLSPTRFTRRLPGCCGSGWLVDGWWMRKFPGPVGCFPLSWGEGRGEGERFL